MPFDRKLSVSVLHDRLSLFCFALETSSEGSFLINAQNYSFLILKLKYLPLNLH
jgi:hypothetical protein